MDENTKNVSTENAENPTPETKAETKPSEQNPDAETLAKYKRLLDKANSEAADYKRQLRAKMSDDEPLKLRNPARPWKRNSQNTKRETQSITTNLDL